MNKIGPIYLEEEEARLFIEVLEKINKEQEQIRQNATKKIATCFALLNNLQKHESQKD